MKFLSVLVFLTGFIIPAYGDILILADRSQLHGDLVLIADRYIEFKSEKSPGDFQWLKIAKKSILAVLNDRKKIIYPRDKFDENALNYGRIPLRDAREQALYNKRRYLNRLAQLRAEKRERDRFKVAALLGSISGVMLWVLLDGR